MISTDIGCFSPISISDLLYHIFFGIVKCILDKNRDGFLSRTVFFVAFQEVEPILRLSRPLALALCAALLTTPAAAATAKKSSENFYVYNVKTPFSAYQVGGNNYVRARDFARATGCGLTYDPETSSIRLTAGTGYDGADETAAPVTAARAAARPTLQAVYVNGEATDIQGYSIGGYNYFKLRDLGRAFGWSVIYNGAQKRVELNPERPYFEKNRNTIVYMYHGFSEDPAVLAAHPNLYTSPWKLRCDIQEMRALGYECISLEDYYQGKAVKGKKYFIITIDDGYLDNYTLAYPVLVQEKAPASIFTIVREMENETGGYFTTEQAREMEESGYVKVYAHNLDHVNCTGLDPFEFDRELQRAYTSLRERLGIKNLFFAYPYGAYNTSTYVKVRDNGFRLQLVQKSLFQADDVLVRQNVWYDSGMSSLIKKAYHN